MFVQTCLHQIKFQKVFYMPDFEELRTCNPLEDMLNCEHSHHGCLLQSKYPHILDKIYVHSHRTRHTDYQVYPLDKIMEDSGVHVTVRHKVIEMKHSSAHLKANHAWINISLEFFLSPGPVELHNVAYERSL